MIKNLKLKYSIMLGNFIPLLFMVLVAIAVNMNIKVVEEQTKLAESANEIISDIKDLYITVAKMQRAARGYLICKNEISPKTHGRALESYKELLQSLPQKVKDPKQQENLRNVFEGCAKTIEVTTKIFSLVQENKPEKAQEFFTSGLAFTTGKEMDDILERFDQRETEISLDRVRKENEAVDFLGKVLLYGVFFALVLALVLGQWLASGISESISEAVNNASSTSSEIAATISQHERTANHQAAMVNETTSTMEELGASSRQSAEQAAAGAEVTKKSAGLAEDGRESVKQAIEAMNSVKLKVEGIAQQTISLSEQTGQVGSIAELVKDFAGQINMLSLNAAVEAARAGEHGKGFAVVATEVRKLSVESKKSAEQTKVILSGIKKATDTTLMKTEEGIKSIEAVTATTTRVGEIFENLSGLTGQVFNSSQQLMLNARQQSLAIGQVIEAVNSINAGAKETAAGLSQTKIGIQNLNEMTVKLKDML